METEYTGSCRLFKEEIEYLNKYWDGKFSNYVHNCFKCDIELTKNNRIKNRMQNMLYSVVMLGFGAFFLLISFTLSNFFAFLIILLLGVFFMSTSLVNIFLEVKNRWKMSS